MSTSRTPNRLRRWNSALLLSASALLACSDSDSPNTATPTSFAPMMVPQSNLGMMSAAGMQMPGTSASTDSSAVTSASSPNMRDAIGMPTGGGMAMAPMPAGGAPGNEAPLLDPMAEETIDEETIDEETIDEETIDEETIDEEAIDEEAIDEEAIDEEAIDEAMDAETGDMETTGMDAPDAPAGDADGSEPQDTTTTERRPPCINSPDEVAIIGDSYINYDVTHTFLQDLAEVSGESWPNYAQAGAAMATGGLVPEKIPEQFERAAAAQDHIKAVIMDGGGNDILIPDATWFGGSDCKNNPQADMVQVCRDIVQASMETTSELQDRMAEEGVEDAVFFFYPHTPGGGLFNAGGSNPNVILDYSMPLAQEACETAEERSGGKLRCYFIDTVPLFEGQRNVFATDGIHPNSKGSRLIAEAVWETMQEACIGQPESSGCCEPQ